MTGFFGGLIFISAVLGLVFVLVLGAPWRSENPTMAWLQAGLGWAAVAFDTLLLLALFHVRVPWFVAAVILLGQDAMFAWRLWLFWRIRTNEGANSGQDR